jgi:hypothetical protein
MNKRIRELTRRVYGPSLLDHENFVMNNDKMERFAELIVRECAEVADSGWADPAHQIKQHFGFEE